MTRDEMRAAGEVLVELAQWAVNEYAKYEVTLVDEAYGDSQIYVRLTDGEYDIDPMSILAQGPIDYHDLQELGQKLIAHSDDLRVVERDRSGETGPITIEVDDEPEDFPAAKSVSL